MRAIPPPAATHPCFKITASAGNAPAPPYAPASKEMPMPHYADGFVIPIPKRNLPAYLRMAKKAAAIWREYGALDYKECAADDLAVKMGLPFTKGLKLKPSETLVFSWIVYKSRAHRDRVNAKIMTDPRIADMCGEKAMPFDVKRMMYGGFKVMVEA
jgi:uncharacterized protein YbaA (DUF1428 family)